MLTVLREMVKAGEAAKVIEGEAEVVPSFSAAGDTHEGIVKLASPAMLENQTSPRMGHPSKSVGGGGNCRVLMTYNLDALAF
jgi:hypothetical protein